MKKVLERVAIIEGINKVKIVLRYQVEELIIKKEYEK